MRAVCIIPAKSNSTRIPEKNIKDFLGKPIIAYSIETARKSEVFERIIVSTDSEKIADIAMNYGADFLIRPGHLAEHDVPDVGTQEVTRHALETIDWNGELACCLYATCPNLYPSDLSLALANLLHRHDPKFVYADGMFYFGYTKLFLDRAPLEGYRMESTRYIDINTKNDWEKAEKMHREMYGIHTR